MQAVARELRKHPTGAEDKLWGAIRKKQLEGRIFRRQVAIGAFVLDFYCASERLAIEVDASIHDEQQAADRLRQELIESLGIQFVRLSNDEVEYRLESSLNKIRRAFGTGELVNSDESPSLILGEGFRVGEKDLKDRTLTNLYNALAVYRGRDDIKTKPRRRRLRASPRPTASSPRSRRLRRLRLGTRHPRGRRRDLAPPAGAELAARSFPIVFLCVLFLRNRFRAH